MQNSMSGGFYAYDKKIRDCVCVAIADFFAVLHSNNWAGGTVLITL